MDRKISIAFIALAIITVMYSCTQNITEGYYEPKGLIMDNATYRHLTKSEYNLIKEGFTNEQKEKINKIITDKQLHVRLANLGTCEISGVIILNDKIIYLTCGTSQLWIFNKKSNEEEIILLNDIGERQLFYLVKEIKGR